MGRPRKKPEEATPQAEETTVEEPALAEEVAPGEPVTGADEAGEEPVAEEVAAPAATPAPPLTRKKPKAKKAERKPKPKRAPASSRKMKPIVRLPKPEHERGRRKERRGVVVSSAMDKTIVVRVDTVKPDRRYKKVVRRSTKLHAHDEQNAAHVGDVVRIVETRPLSKTKHWRLAAVVEHAR